MVKAKTTRFIHRAREPAATGPEPQLLCEQASTLFAGQVLPKRAIEALARMAPDRQIEAAEVMVADNNLTGDFARALLAATLAVDRTDDARGRQSHPDNVRRLAHMEEKLVRLHRTLDKVQHDRSVNLANLALAAAWVRGWMSNKVVAGWLGQHYPDHAVVLTQVVRDAERSTTPGRPMKLPYDRPVSATECRKKRRK
ncbi:hypothetical protein LMG28614_04134 [Paraburkholderia ultramafica]|uniref:RepB plasmid partition domain-containing protein n=1 Tax=Paraburkholderia ultramafica TaxID=1544867 RepID=A0A6S7BE11_9BURK|nr:plasmid partitioning protein RepB C-terminal domain-containing protein [Paraburkholderia ultramafica]CAB3795249.1 hypothetical protein LMG28614_04134 [Paraburkholderia ultramafica]